ncbi:MAG TPA: DNA polymerase III subunit alpha [Bacteroidales bacterium]|nr:DNA polymerase III subunit alpha [Bacteroidales bacterium]HPT01987.1 DNA polymerase III subunit alpha [Bacteroidales bacterium]
MPQFSHLHVHSQYSLLDGASEISAMYKKAVADNMPGLALTDHGNMFGIFQFVAEAEKQNKAKTIIKPIVGCEFYVVDDRHRKKFGGGERDIRYHQILLAKNAEGYANLVKLCSLGFIEGFYSKYPRIDKELIVRYHKGLIATTCCLAASVPRAIMRKGEAEGEKEFKWWLDIFGEDYYIELQRHNIPEQNEVNEVLMRYARKYNVKMIASNDSHYVEKDNYNAHDILLCVNTGAKQATPTFRDYGDDDGGTNGRRFAFPNDQFYFKSTSEMCEVFEDVPEAIDNTNEVVGKIEILNLKKDILLPNFPIPDAFKLYDTPVLINNKELSADLRNQWEYLKHLTMEGARRRYSELTSDLIDRINFELQTIHDMGFAGYFLIVRDFIKAGRDMGVFIGPGRGSAAGSVVAYCIGITSIDPIKYDLLFERFLNPERISMPDIDTDFDDQGRQKVIDYVAQKYGQNQVAQIVTFGTMAAKTSIKDVARVLDLPLPESNALAKLVPDKPGTSLKRVLHAPLHKSDGAASLEEKEGLPGDDLENVKHLREAYSYTGDDPTGVLKSTILHEAEVLEGSVRNTGIHAAGVIIAPTDLSDLIPVCTSKDSNLWITQYEGSIIESAGVIKMDFLGLKNLTIIRDALQLIEQNHGVKLDIDGIPLDDPKTFDLYQHGDTNGTFQFESPGMQQWLRQLKPDTFTDLIAMNALYRPGPMEYIPNYVARKQKREPVTYDLPEMEDILKDTYGITVYQEQVMLLSQKLAGFSKGKADELRKAMGKKLREKLDKMKPEFIEGGNQRGHPADKLEKIWSDWEAFASYAFNKSHSTCYAFVAYQTAYLKVHYPAEYMAALLTSNLNNLENVTFYIDECRRMGIRVLGPDVNESDLNFTVNKNGEIRFGLMALKGVGESAAESIISERKEKGPYTNFFDFVKRVNLRTVNKSSVESLSQAGAFDSFEGMHRAQYFAKDHAEDATFIEKSLRFGSSFQAISQSMQVSLFGDAMNQEIPDPPVPYCETWSNLEKLKREKAIAGFFISGHPLDDYRSEINSLCNINIKSIKENLNALQPRDFIFGGIISAVRHDTLKNGNGWGRFTIEDFEDSYEGALFGEDYLKFKHLLEEDKALIIKARVQERYGRQGQFELKFIQMTLLSEAFEKYAKQLLIQIPLTTMNDSFVNGFSKLVKSAKGDCKLRVQVFDLDENLRVDMLSPKHKVKCSTVVHELGKLGMAGFKVTM